MKPLFLRLGFFLLLASLEVSLVHIIFSDWGIFSSALLCSIAALSVLKGFSRSMWWAFGAGILLDSMLFSPIGPSSLKLSFAAFIFGFTTKRLFFVSSSKRLFVLGLLVWIYEAVTTVLSRLVSSHGDLLFSGIVQLVAPSLSGFLLAVSFSAILFTVVFSIVASLERYLEIFDRMSVNRY